MDKIVSRVITARLRKYMDKMTPMCQKGYSGSRYCQEVLISVMEGIEKCNTKKIKGCVISLDIKKAFDSLSHSYLQSVYKFYNFGPNLIKWITLLSTKRQACVILLGNNTTEFFNLERGNAQGDTISPYLFNLGYQLLLFKLDLSFQIEGTQTETARLVRTRADAQLAGDLQAPPAAGQGRRTAEEVWNPDPKVVAMADDCTLLVKLTLSNLEEIINILNAFELISGLGCNIEKTSLMPVGVLEPIEQGVLNLGLEITNEITLLGANIKNDGICFSKNAENIHKKIKKQVNYWKRFNLSLPGRISVTKTFLYSQINYLGCFLPFTKTEMDKMALEIELFVKGNLKIGKNKFYETKENGGLGLFKIEDFLTSQVCAWVKRSYNMLFLSR